MNLPNRITIARLILCAVFVGVLEFEEKWVGPTALAIFALASFTDWLDGYIARKYNLITDFGKLMDPLADKVLIAAALIHFVDNGYAPAWVVMCVITREFMITGLRVIAASKGVIMEAERLGKHKTVSQIMTAVVGLLIEAHEDLELSLINADLVKTWGLGALLAITLIITVLSGYNYFSKNKDLLFNDHS